MSQSLLNRATYRELAVQMGVTVCASGPVGCRKKWPPGTHSRGKVDQIGVVHWDGVDRRVRRRKRLWYFMVWCGYAKNRPFRNEPGWLGLWHASQWARAEGDSRYHIRFSYEETVRTRDDIRHLARQAGETLRRKHQDIWSWVIYRPRGDRMVGTQEVP